MAGHIWINEIGNRFKIYKASLNLTLLRIRIMRSGVLLNLDPAQSVKKFIH